MDIWYPTGSCYYQQSADVLGHSEPSAYFVSSRQRTTVMFVRTTGGLRVRFTASTRRELLGNLGIRAPRTYANPWGQIFCKIYAMQLLCQKCNQPVDITREAKAKYSENCWMIYYRCDTCVARGAQMWNVEEWKAFKKAEEPVAQNS